MAAVASRGDPHLRSCEIVMGYGTRMSDGARGRIKDLLLDEERRAITVVVVDAGFWLASRRVLLEPQEVERIDHFARKLILRSTRSVSSHRYGGIRAARHDFPN